MRRGNKELLVVGDRVLIKPEAKDNRTRAGLLLPASVQEKEEVRGGTVVAMGPGTPLPPLDAEQEPWKTAAAGSRFLPMQVEEGDYALFFRKAAIEIRFEEEEFLVVPHGAILVLVRGGDIPDELPEEI